MDVLSTERLVLRLWRPEDLPLARQLWGDPEVTRLIDARGRLGDAEVAGMLEAHLDHQRTRGLSYWPAFERETGRFVGCCGLRPEGEDVELGFHIVCAAWGKGYATEAARGVIAYAFGTLGLARLVAGHHPDNRASARVLARLGFEPIGELLYPPTGLRHPHYELRLRREQAPR